jgi:hypothetical protein
MQSSSTLEYDQEASRQLKRVLESFLSFYADKYFLFDRHGNYLDCITNELGARSLLFPREALLGRSLLDTVPASVAEKFQYGIDKIFSGSSVYEFTYSLAIPDLGTRHYETRMVRFMDDQVFAACRDCTGRFRKLELVSEVSQLLSSADQIAVFAKLPRVIAPYLGEFNFIHLLGPSGETVRVEMHCHDPLRANLANELVTRYIWEAKNTFEAGTGYTLSTGEPRVQVKIDEAWRRSISLDERHFQIHQALNLHTFCSLPLKSRGRILGCLTVCLYTPGRAFEDDDLLALEMICSQAGGALDCARLFSQAQEAMGLRDNILARFSSALQSPLLAIQRGTDKLLLGAGDPVAVKREAKTIQRSEEQISLVLEEMLEEIISVALSKVEGAIGPTLHAQLEEIRLSQIKVLADPMAIEHALKSLAFLMQKLSNGKVTFKLHEVQDGVEVSVLNRESLSASMRIEIQKDPSFVRVNSIVEAHQGWLAADESPSGDMSLRLFLPRFRPC